MLPAPLKVGNYEAQRGSKKTFHFNGSDHHVELILRKVISANLISIYGTVADMIRLPRHDQNNPRETDAAVKFEDILENFIESRKISRKSRNGLSTIGFVL